MKAICKIFALAILAVAVAAAASAQDADAPAVHVRFRTLGVLAPGNGGVFFGSEQKDVPIQVDENVRSEFYDYKGPAALSFYRLKTNPDKSVERVSVTTVDLTKAGEWPLLLFTPGTETGTAQVMAVPDDLESFPPGSYRFINRSKLSCTCVLGSETFGLAPGEIKLLNPPPPDATHNTIMAQVSLDDPKRVIYSGNWARQTGPKRLIYSSNWARQKSPRTLVFINEGAGDFGIARRVVELPDILIAETKKSKPK